MSYFPTLSCIALMKIFSKPYSVIICTNFKGYKICSIYLYNFTQLGSSYDWKSQEYYINQSNIIFLRTRKSGEKKKDSRQGEGGIFSKENPEFRGLVIPCQPLTSCS